jgi:hypothetical protein
MYSRILSCVHRLAQLEDEQSVISVIIVFMNSTQVNQCLKASVSHNAFIMPTALFLPATVTLHLTIQECNTNEGEEECI